MAHRIRLHRYPAAHRDHGRDEHKVRALHPIQDDRAHLRGTPSQENKSSEPRNVCPEFRAINYYTVTQVYMRSSLILLAMLAACSDSSGPHHVPVLTTQLSASVDTINGGALAVTLNATNPTDTTLHLTFSVPAVAAQIKISGQWTPDSSVDGFVSIQSDTMSLAAGATAGLGTVYVTFLPPSDHLSVAPAGPPDDQQFRIVPGTYSVRACYFPITGGGEVVTPANSGDNCGNGQTFTLTQ